MTIDHDLALAAKIYRDLAADVALHLPHTPIGIRRVAYQHSGCQYRIEVFQTCVLLLCGAAVQSAGKLMREVFLWLRPTLISPR